MVGVGVTMSNPLKLTRYFYTPTERPDEDVYGQFVLGERLLKQVVVGNLKDHQREALLCLLSDVAVGLAESPSVAFEQSFLAVCLKKGMLQIAASEFHNFCYVKGRFNTRAWEKRKAEYHLFTTGEMLFD